MSAQKIEDTGGSIRLTDSDLIEVPDESAAMPDEVTNKQRIAEMLPFASPDAPTTQARPWELDPTPRSGESVDEVEDEVTNVLARQSKERDWVDTHAVVDDEGRLRLSEEIAKKLQPGAIVEVRVAAWAVDPSENS